MGYAKSMKRCFRTKRSGGVSTRLHVHTTFRPGTKLNYPVKIKFLTAIWVEVIVIGDS